MGVGGWGGSLYLLLRQSLLRMWSKASWPVMTAILQLVLSRTTIISSHRRTGKRRNKLFIQQVFYSLPVYLSLFVSPARAYDTKERRPTQNQNSNYCAVVETGREKERGTKQTCLCLLENIHEGVDLNRTDADKRVSLCACKYAEFCM